MGRAMQTGWVRFFNELQKLFCLQSIIDSFMSSVTGRDKSYVMRKNVNNNASKDSPVGFGRPCHMVQNQPKKHSASEKNKATRTNPARLAFVFELQLCNMRVVPCDQVIQRAYHL